jgi:hypothetical protein
VQAAAQLNTHLSHGLNQAEAARRLTEYGPNELQAVQRVSPWALLLEQFKNILIVILLVAVALSALLGHSVEAVVIGVIVLFAVLLGFVQEYRAERAIEALRQMAAPTATVLRDDEEQEIAARDLVPGDIFWQAAIRFRRSALIEGLTSDRRSGFDGIAAGKNTPRQATVEPVADRKHDLPRRRPWSRSALVIATACRPNSA